MILLPDKWLFVSTMKCATNTLYEALPVQVKGAKWFSEGRVPLFHGYPSKRIAPIHWTVCRNPYDRAVSIWYSTCVRPGNQNRYAAHAYITERGGDPLKFGDFVEYVLLERPELPIRYLWANQSEWHDLFLCDRVFKIESLEKDLKDYLGLELKLPRLNVSEGRDFWYKYYEGEPMVKQIVRNWGLEDFARFGYEE